jgi:hypothetical protein
MNEIHLLVLFFLNGVRSQNDKFAFSRNILLLFHDGINNDSMRQMFLGIICKKLVFAEVSKYKYLRYSMFTLELYLMFLFLPWL